MTSRRCGKNDDLLSLGPSGSVAVCWFMKRTGARASPDRVVREPARNAAAIPGKGLCGAVTADSGKSVVTEATRDAPRRLDCVGLVSRGRS